jgi:hypothetical protein
VYFGGDQYPRLASVLRYTAEKRCPGWDVSVVKVDPTTLVAASGSLSHANNSYKLQWWRDAVNDAPDGARVLLADADTFVLADLDPLWVHEFDFAYTGRDACQYPLNGGVVAARVSARTRQWFDAWLRRDREFLADKAAHWPWRKKYGGINQASLGSLLESDAADRLGLSVARLPCRVWNAEDTVWGRPDFRLETTPARVVHVKTALRMSVFGVMTHPHLRPVVALWRQLEREAAIAYNKG